MGTIVVNTTNDSNDGTVTTTSPTISLRDAIVYAEFNPGTTIDIPAGTFKLSSDLPLISQSTMFVGSTSGKTIIDGQSTYRGFLISGIASDGQNPTATTVGISNVEFQNTVATGGAGTSGGGGGLGAGGAIFVGPAANVTLTNVGFSGAKAMGGAALGPSGFFGAGGGGGGLAGAGGAPGLAFGGGGGGLMAGGSGGSTDGGGGGGGGITAGGGTGADATSTGGAGGTGLSVDGTIVGGGGGGSGTTGGAMGGKGALAGAAGFAGNGGFGGGGGGSAQYAGNGGFGGGGGGNTGSSGGFAGESGDGGSGGFGGGGGGSVNSAGGAGGFGGGGGGGTGAAAGGFAAGSGGGPDGGGGGGALGGAVFVAAGGTLTIDGSMSESGGAAVGGSVAAGSSGGAGTGFGAGIFYEGGPANAPSILNFGSGDQTIDDAIADLDGAADSISTANGLGGTGGVVALAKTGTDTLTLSGDNSYTGGTTFSDGVISVAADDNLGGSAGGLTFSGGTLEAAAGFSSARAVTLTPTGYESGTVQVATGGTATLSGVVSGGGNLEKTGGGTLVLSGNSNYNGGTTIELGVLDLGSVRAAGTGNISFFSLGGTAKATLAIDSAAQPSGTMTFANALSNFNKSAVLDLKDFVVTKESYVNGTLSLTGNLDGSTKTTTENYTFDDPLSTAFATTSDGAGGTDVTVCFAAGTRIRTAQGDALVDVVVQDLRIGDLVVTTSGARRPVTWLGHRTIDCRRHPRPREANPIRVAAHAFGQNRPARDLFLSPGHSVCVDLYGEVLVPVGRLANGATIAQVEVDEVTYWHVELDAHDILLAENLPCESYIDCGTRAFFAESDVVDLAAAPDTRVLTTDDYCRPFHPDGALVDFARERLCLRANDLGWRLEVADPLAGLWLEVDGQRVVPQCDGLVARITLPAAVSDIRLCSDSAVPAAIHGARDERKLGLQLASLVADDGLHWRHEMTCTDGRLVDGFHPHEGTLRWTDGRARLPSELWEGARDMFMLRLAFAGPALPRWVAPAPIEAKAAKVA